MDVEKTIEFLIGNQAAHDERIARIENVVGTLVDNVRHLDDVMVTLAESHIKLVERMDTLTARVDTIAQQSAERDRRLDERVDKVVNAIGEFVRNRPATG